mmetsp:Transcript_16506/g.52577  ORF Transcript_16506/g.52577 Transcript_16506/m.52577 type:complete len:216 (+) Transcript_16506:383-1030(+)
MSLMEAPSRASSLVSRKMPPGLSSTVTTKRTMRPSAARPRSMMRPSVVVSMLPPHSGITIFLLRSSGTRSSMMGANAAAPAPSHTIFSSSVSRSTLSAIAFSDTVMTRSTCMRATSNARAPTCGTARPSASVPDTLTGTGLPAPSAAEKEAQRSGSTPMTSTSGRMVLMASAMPAMRPAPPTGTMTASTSGTCSRISSPMVPVPAMISASSYPLM